MTERIIIVGASVTGLTTALALNHIGHDVLVLERDAAPPPHSPEAAFTTWQHSGVPQLRHSHGFLARLRNGLRDRYPALYSALLEAGAQERHFGDSLPPVLAPHYRPRADDDNLTTLLCRRTTFEQVLYQYARSQGVRFHTGVWVTGIRTSSSTTPRRVTGLTAREHHTTVNFPAEVVIDATGRRSPFPSWLRALGVPVDEETAETGIIYYTRFYRLCAGQAEPNRSDYSSMGDLGYLKFGVFPADNGTFSLTLAIPTVESELRILRHNDAFTKACHALPALAPWLEGQRSEPTTDVFAMGGLQSCYRHFVRWGQPLVLGYFAVGEAAIHTNPLYGRGCSLSFVHAHLLADVLQHHRDAVTRALSFDDATRRELRPFFFEALRQDRRGIRRAHEGMLPRHRLHLIERFARAFVQHGLVPALRSDLTVRRAFLRDFHMLELPGTALRQPSIMLRILRILLQGQRRKATLYPPPSGPDRATMRHLLALAESTMSTRDLSVTHATPQ